VAGRGSHKRRVSLGEHPEREEGPRSTWLREKRKSIISKRATRSLSRRSYGSRTKLQGCEKRVTQRKERIGDLQASVAGVILPCQKM